MSNITAKAILFSSLYKIAIDDLYDDYDYTREEIDFISDACIESAKIIFNKLNSDPRDE